MKISEVITYGIEESARAVQQAAIAIDKKKEQGVAEEWSKKYKKSINCSHPKGFSQKAHCASKTNEAEGDAKGVPHVTKKLLQHIVDQIGTEGAHAIVKSIEWGDGAAKELVQLIKHDLENHIELEESVKQRLDKSCWSGYKKQGTKMKGNVRVNNCVKEEDEEVDEMMGFLMKKPAQQSKSSTSLATMRKEFEKDKPLVPDRAERKPGAPMYTRTVRERGETNESVMGEGAYTNWVYNKGDKLTHGMLGAVVVEKSEGNSVHVRALSDGKIYKVTPGSLKSTTNEASTESKIASLEKKYDDIKNALGMAKERRRAKGQHVQSQREIQLSTKMAQAYDLLSKAKQV